MSQLPVEVIIIILKWVVSEHLDMRSLDNFAAVRELMLGLTINNLHLLFLLNLDFSKVCKGFYVLGRDPRIWRLASSNPIH